MNKKGIFYIATAIFIIVLILLFLLNYLYGEEFSSIPEISDNYVTEVIDGDTFKIYSGDSVRLICIDTPERWDEGYYLAKDFLESLILNKEVRLEKDVSETDRYGRLLRYVYVNKSNKEIFVNKEIVKQGYGVVYRYGDDVKRCEEIENNK